MTRPYAAYLREAALSRVCIDLPGKGDLCHRLVDCLLTGAASSARCPRPLHVALRDGVNICFTNGDMSNLVEVCAELLADRERCEPIALAAREYYERYVRREQLAATTSIAAYRFCAPESKDAGCSRDARSSAVQGWPILR